MVQQRHRADGTSESHAQKQGTGRMYIQCLLTEMGLGAVDAWIQTATAQGDAVLERAIGDALRHLVAKIKADGRWTLPEGRYGSEEEKKIGRPIAQTHPKEITMALRAAINAARQAGSGDSSLLVPKGYFQRFAPYKEAETLLSKRTADKVAAAGMEAKQRREVTLLDVEQIELFESILSCSVAEHQRLDGVPCRPVIDTLTLGVITALYFALGQRGLNLDDMKHGYMSMTRWNTEIWELCKPLVLQLASGCKGDRVGGTKHLAQLMHHRDPMRCPIAMLGLYFAYQFFTLKERLPTLATWLSEDMHRRPLIRLQTGGGANVTAFNARLHEDLRHIDADQSFTFHCIRDQRIAEAGEDPTMRRDSIMSGAGHATGSHATNYRSTDGGWTLKGAGYRPDPQTQAAHVKVLYQYEAEAKESGRALVDALYRKHRPGELLELEAEAAEDATEAGERMRTWLHVVRHCILAWIVSCVARPRDRWGYIDAELSAKRHQVALPLRTHLDVLLGTEEFLKLEAVERSFEDEELRMGELAQRGGEERRTRAQLTGMERRIGDLPEQVAEKIQPHFDSQARALDDEHALGLDRDFFDTKGEMFQEHNPIGSADLRAARLAAEERRRYGEQRQLRFQPRGDGTVSAMMAPSAPPTMCDQYQCIANGAPSGRCLHLLGHARIAQPSRAGLTPSTPTSAKPPAALLPPPSTTPLALPAPAAPLPLSSLTTPPAVPATTAVVPSSVAGVLPEAVAPSLAVALPSAALPPAVPPTMPLGSPCGESTALASLQQQNDSLRAQLADRSSDDPLELKQMLVGGVRQMLRSYLSHVAPRERDGTAWRGTKAVGQKRMQALSDLITKKYEPVLLAVMHQHMDGGMGIWSAADHVEKMRSSGDWKFIKTLPSIDADCAAKYKRQLLNADFAASTLAASAPAEPSQVASQEGLSQEEAPQSTASQVEASQDEALPTVAIEQGTTRYLALDPSLSCGWAVLHVKDATVVAVDCGVIDVKSIEGDGARGLALRKALQPLLTPPPARVFFESYFAARSQHGMDVNIKVRMAIEMAVAEHHIACEEVTVQTWRSDVVDEAGKATMTAAGKTAKAAKGTADESKAQTALKTALKRAVKESLERSFSCTFPANLPISSRMLKFRDDASDAVGVGLWGARQQHASLSCATPVRISTPALQQSPESRRSGKRPVSSATSAAAAAVAVPNAAASTSARPNKHRRTDAITPSADVAEAS